MIEININVIQWFSFVWYSALLSKRKQNKCKNIFACLFSVHNTISLRIVIVIEETFLKT